MAKHVKEKLTDCPPAEEEARVKEALDEVRQVYEGELRQHFWDEERILGLYEVHMGTEEPLPARIRRDHRLLENLMAQGDKPSLLAFSDILTHHIRYEEEELFTGWERTFNDAEKEALGKLLLASAPPECKV